MPGEDIEIRIERLHIDRQVRGALCAVHQYRNPLRWAICVMTLIGNTLPSTLETWAIATIRVRGPRSRS